MSLKPTKSKNSYFKRNSSVSISNPDIQTLQIPTIEKNVLYSPKPKFYYILKPGIDIIQKPTFGLILIFIFDKPFRSSKEFNHKQKELVFPKPL